MILYDIEKYNMILLSHLVNDDFLCEIVNKEEMGKIYTILFVSSLV